MNFDTSSIYVLQNETDKIFVIKGLYYLMENIKLKEIKDNETIEKFKYKDLIILEKLVGKEEWAIYKPKPIFKNK